MPKTISLSSWRYSRSLAPPGGWRDRPKARKPGLGVQRRLLKMDGSGTLESPKGTVSYGAIQYWA